MSLASELTAVALVSLTVAFVILIGKSDKKWVQRMLNWFPSILFAYVIPAAFTHAFDWDLSSVYLHNISRNWIIPVTLLAVMSALPFKKVAVVGVKPLVLFVGGSFLIACLPALLVKLAIMVDLAYRDLFIAQAYWKGLVPIVGGWIGGSTSQLILKELVETPENIFLSVLVLDNIVVNVWTILMFQFIKKGDGLSRLLGIDATLPDQLNTMPVSAKRPMNPIMTVAIFLGIASAGYFLELTFFQLVVGMSLAGILLGNFIKSWNADISLQLGSMCIVLIMAILGLRLNFSNLALPLPFVGLVLTWLLLHFIGMIAIAKLLKINMIWVAIASMANLGGISTAPAVTAAYRKDLMPHAVLLAILSMVSGTAWGILTVFMFKNI